MNKGRYSIHHDPDTPLPRQTRVNVVRHLPSVLGGLFILLTRGESFVAYIGPFIAGYAIWDLWSTVTRIMKATGATHYEIFDPKKNAEDARIQ